MHLYYSANSPYARIVRIALLETGLDPQVEKHLMTRERLYSAEADVRAVNPLGRVPTLVLDDGTVLTESKLILDYIDAMHPGPKLLPRDGTDNWHTLAETGQAFGLLDAIVTWMRALLPPEPQRNPATIAWESARAQRALSALEQSAANGAYTGKLTAAQIVLAVALASADARLPEWRWREGHLALSSWFATMAARPSFHATVMLPV